ncbi:MAG: reverse transcriptase domain-containing protein, partial [Candidatus Thiodiazotropha sp.]
FLCSETGQTEFSEKGTLRQLDSIVSDHYPIYMSISRSIQFRATGDNNGSIKDNQYRKIRWDKVDKTVYSSLVENGLGQQGISSQISTSSVAEIESVTSNICTVLREAALKCVPVKRKNNPRHKLRVWTTEISMSLKYVREINKKWKEAGCPNHNQHPLVAQRKQCKKDLRRKIRTEIAIKELKVKEDIVSTRRYDSKLFHSLIRRQRQKGNDLITDLHVGDQFYKGEENVIDGFQEHFQHLAKSTTNPKFDATFDELIQYEFAQIVELVKDREIPVVTMEELKRSINSINKGKATDIYGLMIEHVAYGGEELASCILSIINCIFKSGIVPDTLKNGLLTPIFKNKGSRVDAKYYRGITVLPVMCKLIDSIIKTRIVDQLDSTQSSLQRGFTSGTSPLNAALILEEARRESKDQKKPFILVLLDAKSAFDVVNHKNMMRRLFHCGIQDNHWSLINSLHTNATTSVKWRGKVSSPFPVEQGIRQGGIISTDLYKVYVNPLLL